MDDRMQFARVLNKALRQFEVEGCPEAFDMRVHIDQLMSIAEQAKPQALKDVSAWLIMSCDELRDRDTEEIDYYGVKPSELESLKKGELPK